MNHKAFCLWPFIVGLFLGLVANVQAETIPATYEKPSSPVTYKGWAASINGPFFASKEAFAAGKCGADPLSFSSVTAHQANYQCQRSWGMQVLGTVSEIANVCPAGQQVYGSNPELCVGVNEVYSCPSNQGWTLSGSSCTRPDCPVGSDRNAQGQCVKDCTGKSGQAAPSPSYEFANDGGAPSVGGCNVSCSNWRQSGGGTSIIPLVMVGDACTYNGTSSTNDGATEGTGFKPKPKEPTSPKDCIGSGQGYIQTSSGVTCVSSGQAPEGQNPEVKTNGVKETGTSGTDGNPNPNAPDYKKEETTTENKNGTTTEKTTTTTNGTPDGNGGTTCPDGFTLVPNTTQCTKTTVSKSSTPDFCTANPTSKACLGTEESDECLENPDRVGCTDKGTPGTTPDIDSETRGTGVITPVALAQIDTCPQGMLLPKGLGYYDYGPMCDFATGLKPVILAIAWLSAFFIVLGFSQGDD